MKDLCRAIRDAAKGWPAPVIAVDQEGGRVQRLRGLVPDMPSMKEIASDGQSRAYEAGVVVGEALTDLGFNVDFAPVLDVDSNPVNPIIGDRAFSDDPEIVSKCGIDFMVGLSASGVMACGKHFPGHGDTSADSHVELPVVGAGKDTLSGRELRPFQAAIREGLKMIMTAHCVYTSIDGDHPATLSKPIIGGLLRKQLGFDGVILTDDLGMKAISNRYSDEEILLLGYDAGVDLFLQCGTPGDGERLAATLTDLLDRGGLDRERVDRSARRVLDLRGLLS